jgi:hypothetical protein
MLISIYFKLLINIVVTKQVLDIISLAVVAAVVLGTF